MNSFALDSHKCVFSEIVLAREAYRISLISALTPSEVSRLKLFCNHLGHKGGCFIKTIRTVDRDFMRATFIRKDISYKGTVNEELPN